MECTWPAGLVERLRGRARVALGRAELPTAGSIDSQSVKGGGHGRLRVGVSMAGITPGGLLCRVESWVWLLLLVSGDFSGGSGRLGQRDASVLRPLLAGAADVGAGTEFGVGAAESGQLGDSEPGLHGGEQQRVIASAKEAGLVWGGEQATAGSAAR